MPAAILIPAYNPDCRLLAFVDELLRTNRFPRIIVVDDGSSDECLHLFQTLESRSRVTVLRHAINLGKGAALKTGLNHVAWACSDCRGVVAADADGQHLADDVIRVADCLEDSPDSLIIGAREFQKEVPLRSRVGNVVTKYAFWGLVGTKLSDTQSGLRGIPRIMFAQLIPLKASGYEFELEMLIMCKHERVPVVECPITTVYLENNRSSHFNPIFDSLKIYWVLLRFTMAGLLSAAIDYLIFILSYQVAQNIFISQLCARCVSTGVNFLLVKQAVFFSKKQVHNTLPKYLSLVVVMGFVSYLMIQAWVQVLGLGLLRAKRASEMILYFVNFVIQRDFIFTDVRDVHDPHVDVIQFPEEREEQPLRKAA